MGKKKKSDNENRLAIILLITAIISLIQSVIELIERLLE